MDRQQFILKIETCQEDLRRFLTALCCGDSVLADDLAQDTFVKAFMSLDSLRDASKFKAWVFRIAYTTFLSSRRSQPHKLVTLDHADIMASGRQADEGLKYQTLYMALAALSENERSAILLYYMQGYSIDEIAGITDTNVNAIKQRLSRGRTHLREKLNQIDQNK